MSELIRIDGSEGEGGGQVLRSALSLSMVTGKAFEIVNLRAGRRKPGLRPQHLLCVKASAKICSAAVEGAKLGSRTVRFEPGPVRSGTFGRPARPRSCSTRCGCRSRWLRAAPS